MSVCYIIAYMSLHVMSCYITSLHKICPQQLMCQICEVALHSIMEVFFFQAIHFAHRVNVGVR